ncbi:MAG: response regulator, partial [Mesorhizobium sp.]
GAPEPAAAPNGPIDILIAEDNDVNQLVFGQILNGLGLSYRIAGNGRTAVEMYRALRPRLILMDVSMPEMNGYEATGAIRQIERQNGSHTPIIGVTAHALKGDREKCIEAGMDDYLAKPISPDRLGSKIGTWLSETVAVKTA